MKKRILCCLKIVLFIVLIMGAFGIAAKVLENKSGYQKNAMFIPEAKKDHMDMLFFGTSHVVNGINPVQLYEETGYTSYNLGAFGSPIQSTYWQIMLALEECNPKLIVLDSYMLEYDIRYQDDEAANATFGMQHLAFDIFPLSMTKIRACQDMFLSKEVQREFEFPFIAYHDRWKELNADDFKRVTGNMQVNNLMGADPLFELHSDPYEYHPNSEFLTLESETVGTEYFRKIIEECHKRQVGVVVITVPWLAQEIGQRACGTAYEICAEYGVPYVNMLEAGFIDFNADLSESAHLNILGMQKTTSFFGDWLRQSGTDVIVGLQDHREDEAYNNWNKSVDDYKAWIQSLSVGQKDLYTQLMMLSMYDNDFIIKVNGSSEAFVDNTFIQLMKNIYPASTIDIANPDEPYLLIKNGGSFDEFVGCGDTREWNTSMGNIAYTPYVNIFQTLYVNGNEERNYIYRDERAYADIQILFLSDGSDEFASHQCYTCNHFEYEYSRMWE